jgi:hypothetical protein
MAPKFNWDQYKTEEPSAKGGQKFDWDQFESENAPEAKELGFFEKLESYTGAPGRAFVSSLQDDPLSPGKAAKAAADQFGADPATAPSGRKIMAKAGVPDQDYSFESKEPSPSDPDFYRFQNDPEFREKYLKTGKGSEYVVNPAKDSGVLAEMAIDPMNVMPVGSVVKGVTVGGAKLLSKGVNLAADAASLAGKAGASTVGKLGTSLGKKVMTGAFGIPEESITRYLARHSHLKDKVGAREMMEELSGTLNKGLEPARLQLAAADDAVAKAKQMRSEDLAELQIRRQEAAEALRRAEDQALGEAASRVSSRVRELDKGVKEGSSKAFDILDKEGVRVPTQKLLFDMRAGIKAMKERAVGPEAKQVIAVLEEYADDISKNYPKDIPGGEAKRILQSLDRSIDGVAPGAVGRMSKEDQALSILRRRVDEPLKKSEAYAAQMKPVAEDTRLLLQVDNLASESAAARALQAATRATGKDQLKLIQQLEARYGDKIVDLINRSNLPEFHKLKGILYRVREAKKGAGVKRLEAAKDALQGQYGDALSIGDKLSEITDTVNSVVRQTNPKAAQIESLTKAGNLAGVNMADELADIKTIASFEKGYNRGSANTNFWGALMGGAAGSAFGPVGTVGGLGVGAAVGRIAIDNFGPRIGRIILDQVPLLQRVKPSQWIRSLDVPPQVKAQLAHGFDEYYRGATQATRGGVAASKPIRDVSYELPKVAGEEKEGNRSPALLPKSGPDKWARDGAAKLGLSPSETQRLMQSKEGKAYLIQASDLKPGSARMQRIKEQIQKGSRSK